ncbi:MAG: hypothetical protein AAF561_10150 [Planctomycetota bacterium]
MKWPRLRRWLQTRFGFPPLRPGDVLPAHVLRDKFGHNASSRPEIVVNPAEVPEHLRSIIPHVERWAIPCDVTRHDYFDSQPVADIVDFHHAVLPHLAAIDTWLHDVFAGSLPETEASVHFLYLSKSFSETWWYAEKADRDENASGTSA